MRSQRCAGQLPVGLLRGMGNGRLEPQGTATRAEVATLLMRFASLGK